MASSPQFEKPIIAKFARFHWEIEYYVAETHVYSWIDGCNIGPEFLGYLTEDGQVIGFVEWGDLRNGYKSCVID
jgi:hypothetical protein